MAAGNIFTLMINDGKQDVMLNATAQLQKRLDVVWTQRMRIIMAEARLRFSNAPDNMNYAQDKAEWQRDPIKYSATRSRSVHSTMIEIAKTHNLWISKCYKPFVAMSYSYLKVIEKEGQPKFSSEVSFIIPQLGTWIHDMALHVRLTGLRCTSALDKIKYCTLLGHRLIEQVRFMVNGVALSEYGTEHMNRHLQFKVNTDKLQAWYRNVGQETPNLGYVTPDQNYNEYREYRWFGDGPQTLKREHTEVDMYIPILMWFNLDVAQSFPNCMVPKGQVKMQFKFADLNKLIAVVDYGGGGDYSPPTIATCDLYVNHINTLPEVEKIMMQDYVYSLIRIPKIFTTTLQNTEGAILLKDLKFPVENMTVCFRPLSNLDDIDLWHRNTFLTPVDVMQPSAINDRTLDPPQPTIGISFATYYTETPVVEQIGMTVNDIEIHPVDTVNKYSSFQPYAACGLMTPKDQGWLLFIHQLNQGYDPSGHIDLSKNREIYLKYSGQNISDKRKVQLYVEAQCINFLTIKENSVNLKYYK